MAAQSPVPGRNRINTGLAQTAPSPDLLFPARANLTAAEILAFLPNSLKRPGVVYRFVSNGGTRKTIHCMVNTFRDFETEWTANSCGSMMYKTMEAAGFHGWNITTHDIWHAGHRSDWNEDNLNLAEIGSPPKPAPRVFFKNLAMDVRMMPEGDDALDLTRMVCYCVENPTEEWMYPEDYDTLLESLGGAAKQKKENTDGAVFKRWDGKPPPAPASKPALSETKKGQPKDAKKRKRTTNDKGEEQAVTSPWAGFELGASTPTPTGEPKMAKAEGRKKRTKTDAAVDQEAIDSVARERDLILGEWDSQVAYMRQSPKYVAPPGDAVAPSQQSVLVAFAHGGQPDQAGPYSAYAFGGPRAVSPYRLLCNISQPHSDDPSGWAENLRWEFEQRALFAYNGPHRWNESPEHMELIAQERINSDWASDELQNIVQGYTQD